MPKLESIEVILGRGSSAIVQGAQAVFGAETVNADIGCLRFVRTDQRIFYGEQAIRRKYGIGFSNFTQMTGWKQDDPALHYVAARIYLSYIDGALQGDGHFTIPGQEESLLAKRPLMEEQVNRWMVEHIGERAEEVSVWSEFFSVNRGSRHKVFSKFRLLSEADGRSAAYEELKRIIAGRMKDSTREEPPSIVTVEGGSLYQVSDRDALLAQLANAAPKRGARPGRGAKDPRARQS